MKTKQKPELVETKICNHCGFSTTYKDWVIFNYCPKCAKPTIAWQKFMEAFFYRAHLTPALRKAINQFNKCEFEAAARTALIIVEDKVRERTKLSSIGADLFAKAFAYQLDAQNRVIVAPLIRINNLSTDEERNEHDGIKLLCMGMTRGIRNIVAHHDADLPPISCLSILMLCNMVLDFIVDGSILNERVCVWTRVSKKPSSLVDKKKRGRKPTRSVRRKTR